MKQDCTDIEMTGLNLSPSSELPKDYEGLLRLFYQVETAKREWEKSMDCVPDIVILADRNRNIKRCNKALTAFTGQKYLEILGKNWIETLTSRGLSAPAWYGRGIEVSHAPSGRWFVLDTYPATELKAVDAVVIVLHETTNIKQLTDRLISANRKLSHAYEELKATQARILQQEKMASIGQLAAGVAHEINNPMSFISSNLSTLGKYMERILQFVRAQSEALAGCTSTETVLAVNEKRAGLKIDYILDDSQKLIAESLDGADRVRSIVQNLKNFSRVDQAESKSADINECIETTLNIVWNELKYKAKVVKELGNIPLTRCYPQQLNQVFMNLLVNAAQAIEGRGEIRIRSWAEDGSIFVSVSDTGCGIQQENLNRIFEPFFTTKEVGKGTGLGLSITYDIVKKHRGDISVESEVGKGTTFTVRIPIA